GRRDGGTWRRRDGATEGLRECLSASLSLRRSVSLYFCLSVSSPFRLPISPSFCLSVSSPLCRSVAPSLCPRNRSSQTRCSCGLRDLGAGADGGRDSGGMR